MRCVRWYGRPLRINRPSGYVPITDDERKAKLREHGLMGNTSAAPNGEDPFVAQAEAQAKVEALTAQARTAELDGP